MNCTQEWDLPHKTTFPMSQLLLTLLITTDITILQFLIWLWNHCVLTISTCLSHLHSLNKHWWTTSALLDAAAQTRRQTWASYGQGIICYNRVCYMPWKEEGQSAIRYVRRARNQTQGWGPARAPGGRESEDDPSLCWDAGSRVSCQLFNFFMLTYSHSLKRVGLRNNIHYLCPVNAVHELYVSFLSCVTSFHKLRRL